MTPVRLELAALRSRVKHSTTEPRRSLSTLCRLMNSSIWFDTINLEWFIIHIKGSQVRLEMSQCDIDAAAPGNCMREKKFMWDDL